MDVDDYEGGALTERFGVNGVELAWASWGEPKAGEPPFVLCHGFTGSAFDFSLEIPTLAKSRQVVALDQRGHGRSTNCGEEVKYSGDILADDLIAFLEHVGGGQPVDLLGHSMGGVISQLVTLARPDLVRSLILMDTSGWSFVIEDEAVRNFVQGFITKFDPARGMPPPPKFKSPEDVLIEAATDEEWRNAKESLYFGMDPYAYKALGMVLAIDDSIDLRPQLGSITCPVTVVVGELDHPFIDHATELAATVAHGRVEIIDGAYHSPQLTHADAWRAALETHLVAAHG
ncbi:MAG TPA: alpha/beta hydrolase [Acidimicrobiales bacterium]|jgi:pimeloyl-ACP methyl ester carboxylesterase